MTNTPVALDVLQAFPSRYFAAWNQRDVAVGLEILDPDVVWIDSFSPEPMVGHAGASGFFQGAWTGFPDLGIEGVGAPMIDAANGRVTTVWHMWGTHTGDFPPGAPISGKPFDVCGTEVFELGPDGRATKVFSYWNTVEMLSAIGLA